MFEFFIAIVIFCLLVSVLLKLPMLAEFRQVIIVIALLMILLYAGRFFGVMGGFHRF